MDYKSISDDLDVKFETASSKIMQCGEMIYKSINDLQNFTIESYTGNNKAIKDFYSEISKTFSDTLSLLKDIHSKLIENQSIIIEDYKEKNHEIIRNMLATMDTKFPKTEIVKLDKENNG